MKAIRILIALVLLIAPSVVRSVWFYRGVYSRTAPVSTPDYVSLAMPTPPLTTPPAEKPSAPAPGKIVLVDRAHKNLFDLTELDIPARALTGLGARLEVIAAAPSSTSTASSTLLVFEHSFFIQRIISEPVTQVRRCLCGDRAQRAFYTRRASTGATFCRTRRAIVGDRRSDTRQPI